MEHQTPPPTLVPQPHYDPTQGVFGSHWALLESGWTAVYRRTPPYRGPWLTPELLQRVAPDDAPTETRQARPVDLVRLGLPPQATTLVRTVGAHFPLEPLMLSKHDWQSPKELAAVLGFTGKNSTTNICNAAAKHQSIRGVPVERRDVTDADRAGRKLHHSTRFLYRVPPAVELAEESETEEDVDEWFRCPLCDGDGCDRCDETGMVSETAGRNLLRSMHRDEQLVRVDVPRAPEPRKERKPELSNSKHTTNEFGDCVTWCKACKTERSERESDGLGGPTPVDEADAAELDRLRDRVGAAVELDELRTKNAELEEKVTELHTVVADLEARLEIASRGGFGLQPEALEYVRQCLWDIALGLVEDPRTTAGEGLRASYRGAP